MPHLAYAKIAPEGFGRILDVSKYILACGLEEKLVHMVYLRVSQINGCPYCVDLHWKDAKAAGEDLRKLNAVVIWRDTPFFSDKERAALHWAEVVTRLEHQQIPKADFDATRAHFTDKEITDLTFTIAQMNALNRIAIAFHQMPAL